MSDSRQVAARLQQEFIAAGAQLFDAPALIEAKTLLDLYGEDIRTRAYITNDTLRGELILRPDFTVPLVQHHLRDGADPARYTYCGSVWRMQNAHSDRPNEYLQVGFELFAGHDLARADAEVFALFQKLLGAQYTVQTGDIGLLRAGIEALSTSAARKEALLRHLWRPKRFGALLERFANKTKATGNFCDEIAPEIGLRTQAEVQERLKTLSKDYVQAAIATDELHMLDALRNLSAPLPAALLVLQDLIHCFPALSAAVERFEQRLNALQAAGVDSNHLLHTGHYGLTGMEYYDGFVFGFARADGVIAASGGRYDALCRALGAGTYIPAVGGVIRPADLLPAEKQRA